MFLNLCLMLFQNPHLTIYCSYLIALQMSILIKPGPPLITIFTSIFPKVTYLKTPLIDLMPGYGMQFHHTLKMLAKSPSLNISKVHYLLY